MLCTQAVAADRLPKNGRLALNPKRTLGRNFYAAFWPYAVPVSPWCCRAHFWQPAASPKYNSLSSSAK